MFMKIFLNLDIYQFTQYLLNLHNKAWKGQPVKMSVEKGGRELAQWADCFVYFIYIRGWNESIENLLTEHADGSLI